MAFETWAEHIQLHTTVEHSYCGFLLRQQHYKTIHSMLAIHLMIKTSFVQDRIMFPVSLLEAAVSLLLLLITIHYCKLVLALEAAQNALQAVLEEYQILLPLDAGADALEQPVQETGVPIGHGLFETTNYPGAQCVQPLQDTQPAFQLQDAMLQAVGGLGTAQESLYQRNLPAAMVAGLHIEVSSCS